MIECPLCSSISGNPFQIKFSGKEISTIFHNAIKCENCGIEYLDDYTKTREDIYNESYSVWGNDTQNDFPSVKRSKIEIFKHTLNKIIKKSQIHEGNFLDIGTGTGLMLDCARDTGFLPWGIEFSGFSSKRAAQNHPSRVICGTLNATRFKDQFFNVITMTDVLEHLFDPVNLLQELNRILSKSGILCITTPDTNSITKKILGANWFQYKREHLLYYNRKSIEYLLTNSGFKLITYKTNIKFLNLKYCSMYAKKYSNPFIESIFNISNHLPAFLREYPLPFPFTGEALILATKN
jgi:ubiquinone/menaquinone biosynthesis C-methylase UbiE